jgi:predicted GIY-YIG superfamily endonuclease
MPYSIYVIEGPTGKQYVGISKNVKARWYSHVRKAARSDQRHPFYDAIRKHGAKAFSVTTLYALDQLEHAKACEQVEIAVRRLTERQYGYNVSRGGEYDGVDGPAKFWRELRADPERYRRYCEALRVAGKARAARGQIDSSAVEAYVRSLSPRQRWEQRHRATRVAAKHPHRNGGPKVPNGNAVAVKAAWEAKPKSEKKRHAIKSRENAKALWARRTAAEKEALAMRIAESVRRLSDDPSYREKNLAGLAKGRANMDRSVQGAAASEGLKKFWRDLKSDPVRYAAYMKRRTATLLKTLGRA